MIQSIICRRYEIFAITYYIVAVEKSLKNGLAVKITKVNMKSKQIILLVNETGFFEFQ